MTNKKKMSIYEAMTTWAPEGRRGFKLSMFMALSFTFYITAVYQHYLYAFLWFTFVALADNMLSGFFFTKTLEEDTNITEEQMKMVHAVLKKAIMLEGAGFIIQVILTIFFPFEDPNFFIYFVEFLAGALMFHWFVSPGRHFSMTNRMIIDWFFSDKDDD